MTYDVLREGPTDSTFVQVATGLSATQYIDMNVTPGMTYMYEVDSANTYGTSVLSSPFSVTVPMPPKTPPPTPTGVGADATSGTDVVLTWGVSAGATSYSVSRMGPNDTTFVSIASGLTALNFTDMNVSMGSTYEYEIAAANGAGLSAFHRAGLRYHSRAALDRADKRKRRRADQQPGRHHLGPR